jgi:hypothetical protein
MALTAKPARSEKPAPNPTDIEAFISRGGAVAAPTSPAPAKPAQHPLKFPADGTLFTRMEASRKASTVKLPRNTWILQAIAEKLERDMN